LECDRQYFISFALEIEVIFSKNNVLCQPNILLVFSAGDLILPRVSGGWEHEALSILTTTTPIMQSGFARLLYSSRMTGNGRTTPPPSYRATFEQEGGSGSMAFSRSDSLDRVQGEAIHPSGTPALESDQSTIKPLRLNYRGDSVLTVSPDRFEVC
jgi:hypothetical protein